ncbi:MAG: DinB family protein [Bacteroidota bacterium]
MSHPKRPQEGDYNPYYATYVSKVEGDNIYQILKKQGKRCRKQLKQLTEEQWNYRYAPGKWSIKEVLIHICDTERIFAYRMLRIARRDATPMPGFDQNDYVPYYRPETRSIKSLLREHKTIRAATLSLLSTLSEEDLAAQAVASDSPVTGLALAFIIAGHERHHMLVLQERYFSAFAETVKSL